MPSDLNTLILSAFIFIAAVLYSSVGHAGASGYLAAMALLNVSPSVMKPTALALNILVASIACFKFYRVKAFSWRLFLPLALASTPCAFLGGLLTLPSNIYKPLVGLVLCYASIRSFIKSQQPSFIVNSPSTPSLILCGAGLGFLSGITGVGGGIFLSPIMLLWRWADTKTISGIAAAFILVNSIAGFLGVMQSAPQLPQALPLWLLAAGVGGYIGAEIGSKHLPSGTLQKILSVVLMIAGVKMLLS
jgi:uncharacterized membrane protein YfcA